MTVSIERPLPEFLQNYRILSAKQAAEMLSISIATLRRLHAAGRLPGAVRLSDRRIGWKASDLILHLADKAQRPA